MEKKLYERLTEAKREKLLIKAMIHNDSEEYQRLVSSHPLNVILNNPKKMAQYFKNCSIGDAVKEAITIHHKYFNKALIIYQTICQMACIAMISFAGILDNSNIKADYEGFKRYCHEIL